MDTANANDPGNAIQPTDPSTMECDVDTSHNALHVHERTPPTRTLPATPLNQLTILPSGTTLLAGALFTPPTHG